MSKKNAGANEAGVSRAWFCGRRSVLTHDGSRRCDDRRGRVQRNNEAEPALGCLGSRNRGRNSARNISLSREGPKVVANKPPEREAAAVAGSRAQGARVKVVRAVTNGAD